MTRLLVVDDSALARKLVGRLFADEADFEVATARDCVEALAALEAFAPDVIILDVHMPKMDGLTCLDRIMLVRPTPVVMLSATTAEGAAETLEAMALGAVDVVEKPTGALSLGIAELGPRLVTTVRAAARARLRASHRLAERLRARRAGEAALVSEAASPRALGAIPQRDSAASGLVLVGASTGGPTALDILLSALPAEFPWPVLVAQHIPAMFTGPLARRLDRLCALNVVEVTSSTPLDAGRVYVGRGDADLIVARRGGRLAAVATPSSPDFRWHPSVDRLVDSALALLPAEQLIGVLMTGMGADGARAMARLRAGGGLTLAQSEATAVVWGMPGELVRLGGASAVLPLERLGAALVESLSSP